MNKTIFGIVEIFAEDAFSVDVSILGEYKHKSSASQKLEQLEKQFPKNKFKIVELTT